MNHHQPLNACTDIFIIISHCFYILFYTQPDSLHQSISHLQFCKMNLHFLPLLSLVRAWPPTNEILWILWCISRLYVLFTKIIFYLFFTLKKQRIIYFLKISDYTWNHIMKENAVETSKSLETLDFLWNMGNVFNLIYFIALNAIICVKVW